MPDPLILNSTTSFPFAEYQSSTPYSGGTKPFKNQVTPEYKPNMITSSSATITMGHSISAYGEDSTGSYSVSVLGWASEFLRASGLTGFDVIQALGVPGATIEQMIAVQVPAAIRNTAGRTVFMQILINNLNSALANNDSVAVIVAQMKAALDLLSPVKDLIIVSDIQPINQSGTSGARPRAYQIPTINGALRVLFAQYPNVIMASLYDRLVDAASVTLDAISGYLLPDGIHNQSVGAKQGGYALFLSVADKIRLFKYRTKGPNVLPDFVGTGGNINGGGFVGVTGTPPLGWELMGVSGASATNTVAFSTLAPDMIRMSVANTGAATATTYLRVNNLQANFTQGDITQFEFGYQLSGMTGFNRLAAIIRLNGGTSYFGMMQNTTNEPTISYPQTNHGGIRSTNPVNFLPGTVTNTEAIIGWNLAATTGAGIIDIYAPWMGKLLAIS